MTNNKYSVFIMDINNYELDKEIQFGSDQEQAMAFADGFNIRCEYEVKEEKWVAIMSTSHKQAIQDLQDCIAQEQEMKQRQEEMRSKK